MLVPNDLPLAELVRTLRGRKDCELLPPDGVPVPPPGMALPADLDEFYMVCGGGLFFQDSDFPFEILSPSKFAPANLAVLRELDMQDIRKALPDDHFSWGWFTIANFGTPSEIAAICLAPRDFGRCFACDWVRYPNATKHLASDFSAFLKRLLEDEGRSFWEDVFEDGNSGKPEDHAG